MYVSYEGDKKALFLFHCGLLLFCMTDDDGDWRGQIRLFPSFPLKCLIFSLLSVSFTSFSLSSPPKGAYWFWIWQGPDLTPAASGPATRLVLDVWADHRLSICFLTSGLTNQVQFWDGQACLWGCVSRSPSLYLFSYIWFDKSGTILTRAGLSMRICVRITVSRLWHLSLASRWGNYQSGHRLYLPWWNYTFFICPWWPNIPWSWLNNQGFKMMYQKMCLGIRY